MTSPREITAKFDSICPSCDCPIDAGTQVLWQKGRKATHVDCHGGGAAPGAPSEPAAMSLLEADRQTAIDAVRERLVLLEPLLAMEDAAALGAATSLRKLEALIRLCDDRTSVLAMATIADTIQKLCVAVER